MAKKRRKRIFDETLAEIGREMLVAIRQLPEVRALIEAGDAAKRKPFTALVADVRTGAVARKGEVERAMAVHVLQDPVSSILGRLKRGASAEESATAKTIAELAGKREPKPRLAVALAPKTLARVVEVIGKRHPEIAMELNKLGLSVEDGTRLMFRILDYSKARSSAGVKRRINSRGGILYEMLLPYQPGVVAKERIAAAENAADWVRSEPGRFGMSPQQAEQFAQALAARITSGAAPGFGRSLLGAGDAPALGDFDLVAQNMWVVRLTDVRDEAGRLMSDHFRTLISRSTDGKAIDLVPVGVGESKFQSKASEVLPQLVQNLERARDTLRASNLPDLENLEIRVRWGKKLVVIGQSEKEIRPERFQQIEADVKKATGAGKDLKLLATQGATKKEADASRRVVELFMKLANEGLDPE